MRATHMPQQISRIPPPKEIFNYRVYVLALISSMGAFLFGYDLAFIGTTITQKPFVKDFGLTDASASKVNAFAANIVSLLQAGCFFGALVAAPLGDKFGRKLTLVITGVVFCIGSIMQTASMGSTGVMFAGRAVGGLVRITFYCPFHNRHVLLTVPPYGVGAASMLVPLYIAEVAPPSIRGRLVGIYEIGVQCGTCIGFWINYGVTKHVAPTSAQWQIPFGIQLLPGTLLVVGMFLVPESPRWIARFQTREAAIAVLAKLRNLPIDHEYILDEMYAITDQLEQERLATSGKGLLAELREIILPGNRRRIATGVIIFIFMQMAGSNAINYYSPRIFASIGLKGQNTALISTGVYGIVRFVAVCIAMYFVVDRFGRKNMLISGSAVAAFAMWFIGAFVKISPATGAAKITSTHISAGGYAAATMIYIYAVAFCFSWAGIPWIYASEIFPLRIRSVGVALCVATHWLMNFVIARSVPYMITNIKYGTYFVFAASLTLSIPFVFFFVPETKGLSLEDMDTIFGVAANGGNHHFPTADEEKATNVVEHKE